MAYSKRPVYISDTARTAFNKIIQETIQNFGQTVSGKLILRFEAFIKTLESQPQLFGHYLRSKNIRKFILTKSHLVLYKVKRKEVEIIAIVYAKQKPISIRRKLK